jgi:inner membrane protein
MNYKTHLAFALLLSYFVFPYIHTSNKYIFFSFVLIGALLPDIDFANSKISRNFKITSFFIEKVFKHRGLFHSLFSATLLSATIYILINNSYGLAFFIGYFSHLISDGFTKTGVNFLHPITNLRLSGFIETGSFIETIFFLITIAFIISIRLLIY